MAAQETILVFDSGLGGLTVYREMAAARPHADYVYVADDAAFPYGAIDETALVARVVELIGELIVAHRPDLVVIACNTASTIVLPRAAQGILAAVRRHRACDQAGLRQLRHPARVRARHRSDGEARIYPRADPRLCAGIAGSPWSDRQKLARLCRGGTRRHAGRRRRDLCRDRALLSPTTARGRTRSCSPAPIIRC